MELINDTVGNLLEKWAFETPDSEFIVYPDYNIRWTFKEFNERVDIFAKGLMEIGVTKDTKVGIWANNIPDWNTVFFATAKIGACLVTVNTNYKLSEVEYLMKNADIHTMCMIDQYRDSNYVDMMYELIPSLRDNDNEPINCENLPLLRNIVLLNGSSSAGMHSEDSIMELGRKADDAKFQAMKSDFDCHCVVNMQYTSGTTGFPKGVMLSHHNIINNGLATGDAMSFTTDDRLLVCVPLFHCFGIVLAVCSSLVHGNSMIFTVDFKAEDVLRLVEKERCTILYGVPTMFVAELHHENFDKYDLSSLRTGIMAGSVCPIETMREVMSKMHMKDIISVYGLTESSPGMTCSKVYHSVEKRATTVGTEYPNVEVKIFNTTTGKECEINEPGEICCRGYNVMKGYYNNPKATAQTIDKDGWLHSGDLAIKDEEGFYHITGRIKDMIIRGGENIYPREIENFLMRMSQIKMVEVVGIPDEKYGEIVGAFIILKDNATLTQEEVQEFCKGQIARYKIPKHVFFIDDYPKTGSGKVMKYKLREMGKDLVDKIMAEQQA